MTLPNVNRQLSNFWCILTEQLHKDWLQQRDQIPLRAPSIGDNPTPIFSISSEYTTNANMSQESRPYHNYSHGEYPAPESSAAPPAYEEACNSSFSDVTAVFPATPANYDYFYPIDRANRLSPHWHSHYRSLSGSDDLSLRGSRSARDPGRTRPVSQGILDATGCFFVPR